MVQVHFEKIHELNYKAETSISSAFEWSINKEDD